MSFGLLVKNADGSTVVDPSTFTVRMVDAKAVDYGFMGQGAIIDVPFPSARKGSMFAQVVPLWRRNDLAPQLQAGMENSIPSGWNSYRNIDYFPRLPGAEVFDGYVRLYCLNLPYNTRTLAHVAIYLMTYI